MWRNKYNSEDYRREVSPVGSPMAVKTGWTVDKSGDQKFVVKSTFNLYERIQAARDSVDLQALLKRYEAGDNTALDRVQATYFDLVDMPTNYAEMYQAIQNCNDIFAGLPVDIKEAYNNNPAKFWADSGTSKFDNVINAYRSDILRSHAMLDEKPMQTAISVPDPVDIEIPTTPVPVESEVK